MDYERIHYLRWERTRPARVRYDLAASDLRVITKEDLGLDEEEIEIRRKVISDPVRLQQELAARYDLPPECIQLTCGATMGIFAAFEALLEPGDEVLLEVPNYEPLYAVLKRKRIRSRPVDRLFENGWELDLTEVQRKIGPNTAAIVLTNLQNPTGVATPSEKMTALSAIGRDHDAFVVVDEAYLEPDLTPKVRPAMLCGRNTVSIGSFSKTYGLPDLRVGWIACRDEDFMERVGIVLNDYLMGGPSMPAVSVADLALRRRESLLPRIKDVIDTNLKILSAWVSRHNDFAWVRPSGGPIAFIKLPGGVDDRKLAELLQEKYDTRVTPGHFFWKPNFIRLSFGCAPDVLRAGLRNIQAAVDELLGK